MGVSGTLYTYPGNFRAERVLAVAKFANADVKVDDKFVFGETNKSDAFLKKFPLGKVPAFEGSDGTCLFESDAIAYYVANAQLRGGDSCLHQAQVAQYVSFAQNEILPAACTWVFPTLGIMQYNKTSTERAKVEVQKAMEVLNKHLLTKTYLVGERITLADISVAYAMMMLFENVLDAGFRKPYGNVVRWYTTIMNQPQVIAVSGQPKLPKRWPSSTPRSTQRCQAREIPQPRRRRRKRRSSPRRSSPRRRSRRKLRKKPLPLLHPRPRTPSPKCPPETSSWMTSRGSTPTTTSPSPFLTSSRSSTTTTTPSGTASTCTPMSS